MQTAASGPHHGWVVLQFWVVSSYLKIAGECVGTNDSVPPALAALVIQGPVVGTFPLSHLGNNTLGCVTQEDVVGLQVTCVHKQAVVQTHLTLAHAQAVAK
jgi:hypothetical protein